MSATGLRNLDTALQKTNIWLRDIAEELHWEDDRNRAYMALRVTLHAVRDHLTVEEAAHFGAQLPMIIRGVYYEGWKPSKVPVKDRHLEGFLAQIRDNYNQAPGSSLIDPTRVCRAVFEVINEHVTAGEVNDVRGMLPQEIARLWPEPRMGGDMGQQPQPGSPA